MSLINKIEKAVEASILEFCKVIASKHDLDVQELTDLWSDMTTLPKKAKKKSAYLVFSNKIRGDVRKENPDVNFGEISKLISLRWKNLSEEEKEQYRDSKEESDPEDENSSDLMSLKLKDLKDRCKAKGIKISGSKKELILRLQNADRIKDDEGSDEEEDENNDDEMGSPPKTPAKKQRKPRKKTNLSTPASDMASPLVPNTPVKKDKEMGSPFSNAGSPKLLSEDMDLENMENGISPVHFNTLADLDEEEDDERNVEEGINYAMMKLPELRELCKNRGLSSKGNKTELVERLA